jgi:hypothetical protein
MDMVCILLLVTATWSTSSAWSTTTASTRIARPSLCLTRTTGSSSSRRPAGHSSPKHRTLTLVWTKKSTTLSSLSSSHDADNDDDHPDADNDKDMINIENNDFVSMERISSMVGVSVSPQGFQVVLKTATTQRYLVIPVTSSHEDSSTTTTPEALTMIQLVNGVDMAGMILPPDVLAKMVVLNCEEAAEDELEEWEAEHRIEDEDDDEDEYEDDDDPISDRELPELVTKLSKVQHQVLSFVQGSLSAFQSSSSSTSSTPFSSYTEAHPWVQNKLRLPIVTLDQVKLVLQQDNQDDDDTTVQIKDVILECAIRPIGSSLMFSLTESVTSQVCHHYDAAFGTSQAFLAVALALRYRAPMVLEYAQPSSTLKRTASSLQPPDATLPYSRAPRSILPSRLVKTRDDVSQILPQWATIQKLQSSSRRVSLNIEQGFEIHKLQGALRIAMQQGDQKAIQLIRAKLDEYDSMEDLPTTSSSSSSKGMEKNASEIVSSQLQRSSSSASSRLNDELEEDSILQ